MTDRETLLALADALATDEGEILRRKFEHLNLPTHHDLRAIADRLVCADIWHMTEPAGKCPECGKGWKR